MKPTVTTTANSASKTSLPKSMPFGGTAIVTTVSVVFDTGQLTNTFRPLSGTTTIFAGLPREICTCMTCSLSITGKVDSTPQPPQRNTTHLSLHFTSLLHAPQGKADPSAVATPASKPMIGCANARGPK